MNWLIPGVFAFLCFAVSDYGKLRAPKGKWNLLFFTGGLALFCSTIGLIPFEAVYERILSLPLPMSLLLLLTAISTGLLVYTLFFALPFNETYLESSAKQLALVNKGVYSLCRHPGVLFFAVSYFLLMLVVQDTPMTIAFILYTILDIIYVIWQDYYLFPKTISDYDSFKKVTPFLLPNRKSMCAFFEGLRVR